VSGQTSPFAGTWKLNVEKTKLASGPAQPVTMIITVNGEEETMRTESPYANGYVARYDGKDYPMKNMKTGVPSGVMTSLTRIDARTVDRAEKRDGKVTSVTRRVLSPDGKVMTSTTPGTDRDGKPTKSVRIWEKQ
jgi:hypothetical protein